MMRSFVFAKNVVGIDFAGDIVQISVMVVNNERLENGLEFLRGADDTMAEDGCQNKHYYIEFWMKCNNPDAFSIIILIWEKTSPRL